MSFDKEKGDIFTSRYIEEISKIKLIVPTCIQRMKENFFRKADGQPKIYQEALVNRVFKRVANELGLDFYTKTYCGNIVVTWELDYRKICKDLNYWGLSNVDKHLKYDILRVPLDKAAEGYPSPAIQIESFIQSMKDNQERIEKELRLAIQAKENIETYHEEIEQIRTRLRELRHIIGPHLQGAYFEDQGTLDRLY